MRAVLKSNRLLLLKKILHDEAYPDHTLADDMAAGFSLVGEAPTHPATNASIHVDELSAGLGHQVVVRPIWLCGRRRWKKETRGGWWVL